MAYLTSVERSTRELQARTSGTAVVPVGQTQNWAWPTFSPRLGAIQYSRNVLVRACIDRKATSATEAKLVLRNSAGTDVTDGALAYLLENPCYDMPMSQWLRLFITYLEIAGNVYVYRRRNGGPRSRLTEWRLLRPDRVTLKESSTGQVYWNYQIGGRDYPIPYDDILQFIHYPDPLNDVYGLSPLAQMVRENGIDSAATDYTRAFIDNSAVPAGFMMINGVLSGGEVEARAIAKRWSESAGGMNRGNLLVVEGDAKYEQASPLASPEMPDLRALTETRICMGFGVPPLLVQTRTALATSSGRAEFQQARRSFWEETMSPLYIEIGQFLTILVRRDFGSDYRVEFDLSEVKALQENQDLLDKRIRGQWNDWVIKRSVTKRALGHEVDEAEDEIYKYEIVTSQQEQQARLSEERKNTISDDGEKTQSIREKYVDMVREMAIVDGVCALTGVMERASRRIDGQIGGAIAGGKESISARAIEQDVSDALGGIMWRLAIDVCERGSNKKLEEAEIHGVMLCIRNVIREWDEDVRRKIDSCGTDFIRMKDIVNAHYKNGTEALIKSCADSVVELAMQGGSETVPETITETSTVRT